MAKSKSSQMFDQLVDELKDLEDDGWLCEYVDNELHPQDYPSYGYRLIKGDAVLLISMP